MRLWLSWTYFDSINLEGFLIKHFFPWTLFFVDRRISNESSSRMIFLQLTLSTLNFSACPKTKSFEAWTVVIRSFRPMRKSSCNPFTLGWFIFRTHTRETVWTLSKQCLLFVHVYFMFSWENRYQSSKNTVNS